MISLNDKKYILFDLDGTITDSCEGIVNSVRYALKKFEIIEYDTEVLYKFIGPPLLDSFMKYYGFSKEKAVTAVKYYREYYSKTGIFENRLYEGIGELLKELHQNGKRVILATSKPEKFADIILEHFNISKYFDFVGGATMNEKRSQKEEVIDYILKSQNISPDNAVMIGDTKFDIIGAHMFGMEAIGVLYGFGSEQDLIDANADHIVTNVNELKKLLI